MTGVPVQSAVEGVKDSVDNVATMVSESETDGKRAVLGGIADGKDQTLMHTWMMEPSADGANAVITPRGLEFIASHKYKPGHSTHLDNLLNPVWTWLTYRVLPLTMAPNMVTTIGGLHCLLSYLVLWHYSPNYDSSVPDWTLFLSGYCAIVYYILDCMDGKQSRRTSTSSPLGQLFDHGIDCICNLSHCATAGGYTMIGGSKWFLLLQSSLQFSFFMAQWEEYYTHVLPHAAGKWVGVTETNYFIGIVAIGNAFIDRSAFWGQTLQDVAPFSLPYFNKMELRHVSISFWLLMVACLIVGSAFRVLTHEDVLKNKTRLSAMSKLLSPLLIAVVPFACLNDDWQHNTTRYISIASGLLFSLLTIKMIVFSMAKMSFATIQLDILPFGMACLWIRYDTNLTKDYGTNLLLGLVSAWYLFRLIFWATCAIRQICHQLDIYCFTIKRKRSDKKK